MMSVEELGHALVALGFTPGKISSTAEGHVYRTGRVALAVTRQALQRCFEPPQEDETGAPWPLFLKLEVRWLQAADIFRKNGLPVHPVAFEQYLTCLAKMGLFPTAVEQFYEFEAPEVLDLALSVNTQTMADELTPEVVQERLQPLVDALVRAELYMVFGATLEILRHELHQRKEQEKIRLTALL